MAWWNGKKDAEKRSEASGLATPEQWLFDLLGGNVTPSGQKVTVEKALGLVPVWAAVRLISEQIAMLPLKVYRNVDGEDIEADHDYRGWRLLHDMPNANTPAGRFWATVSVHLLLWGNSFLLKGRSNGVVDELLLLKPEEVTVLWNPATGEKKFRHMPEQAISNPSLARVYDDSELLHIFGMSLDGVVGASVIEHCANALGVALARDKYEGGFYNRGARLSGVLEADGQLSDQARKNLKATFPQGSESSFGTPLLEEGIEFKPISSPMRDLEFVASQQLSRTDIAVMFNLPPNKLGGSSGDSLTYATVEDNQLDVATYAIAPITTTIGQFLSHDPSILPQNVFSAAFDLAAMLRADSKTRADVYTLALGNDKQPGWMTREEVRLREKLSPADKKPEPMIPPAPPGQQLAIPNVAAKVPAANGNGN